MQSIEMRGDSASNVYTLRTRNRVCTQFNGRCTETRARKRIKSDLLWCETESFCERQNEHRMRMLNVHPNANAKH